MEESDPDAHITESVRAIHSRFSPIGCTGLLTAALILFMVAGVRFGRSQVVFSESISEVVENNEQETEGEVLSELQTILPTPTVLAQQSLQVSSPPTSTPKPTVVPESTPTREAGSQRASIQQLPTAAPTILEAIETPAPLPIKRPPQDFTIDLNPTPSENHSTTVKVPILMYHYISNPPADADIYREDLSVTPENFREQMLYLVEEGFTTIDLYDLSMAVANNRPLPEKPVILTFDDGYLDNYQNSYPILLELGLIATFFVATGFVDAGNPNYMDWPMIEEMSSAGMRIEPHSKSHRDLRDEDRAFLVYEIQGSQETIAAHLGYMPRYFAYPGGRYDDPVIEILTEREFWGSVTTVPGRWHSFDDRYEWTRQRVRFSTSLRLFSDLVD